MEDHVPISAETAHPAADELIAFGQGQWLAEVDVSRVEQHLTDCRACGEFLSSVAPDSFERAVKGAGLASAMVFDPVRLVAGYEILDELGRGGMGAGEHRSEEHHRGEQP